MPKNETTTQASAWGYNPIFQKRDKLTWNSPQSGYVMVGPPPDVGTSYGTWWDDHHNFGVIAPLSKNGQMLYSPASGEELRYEGPATADALYAIMNFKGAYEFLPPTKSGETCLTSAPIFAEDFAIEQMYHPFSGADVTQEYQTMKANRTAQPATTKVSAKLTLQRIDAMTSDELSQHLMSMLTKAAEGEDAPAGDAPAPKSKDAKSKEKSEEKSEPTGGPAEPADAPPPAESAPPAEAPPAEAPPAEAPPAEAPPADTPPADAPPPPADATSPPSQPPASDAGPVQPAAEPVAPAPSVQKEEPPTPTTKEQLGVESMSQAKELKALALKLITDPSYATANKAEVDAALSKAKEILSSKGTTASFYAKEQKKALDAAQKKTKLEGEGFYSDTIETVREKTIKDLEKVSSMIDEKILAALANMDPAQADAWNLEANESPEHEAAEPSAHEASESPEEEMGELSAAMAAIENALRAVGGKSKSKSAEKERAKSLTEMAKEMEKSAKSAPKSAPKSKSEPKSEPKSQKEVSADADADYQALCAEIDKMEAELAGKPTTEAPAAEPVMEAPMAADASPAPVPAAPPAPAAEVPAAEPAKSEGYAVELVSSAADLEAAGPVMANSVQMTLFNDTTDNPFWNIVASGEPIGRVYLQDQADPQGDRAYFTSAKYASGVSSAVEKVGLTETMNSISAKFFANRIVHSDMVQKIQVDADKVIKATVAQKTASLRDDLVDRMMVAQAAIDKNMFKEEGNALKDAMYVQMSKFGVANPIQYIEAAFEAGSREYFNVVISKAIEFLDMEPKAFEQIKKTVAGSDVLAPPADVTASTNLPEVHVTLASHLANNVMPLSFTHDAGTLGNSYASTKDVLRANLSLKSNV